MSQSRDELRTLLGPWDRGGGRKTARLAAAIERVLVSGALDGPLPAERRLAEQLGVSRGTVTAAYAELKERRLLASRPGGYTRPDRANLASPVRAARLAARGMAEGTILGNYVERDPDGLDLSFAFLGVPGGMRDVVAHAYVEALEESPTTHYVAAGLPELRACIAGWYTQVARLRTTPEQIVITQGAYQGIVLATLLTLQPGDRVAAEVPLYPGALDTFRAHDASIVAVEAFDEATLGRIAGGVRLIYATSVWRNPTGALLDRRSAERLARFAEHYEIPLIDDRALEHCGFAAALPAPLAAYAPAAPILTLGSLDKTTGAGTRIGWIRGPRGLAGKIARLKAMSDLASPTYLQRVAARLFDHLEPIARARRLELRRRYDGVSRLLHERFPRWSWQTPVGGPSIWVDTGGDADALVRAAGRAGVTLIAAAAFRPDAISGSFIRIALAQPESAVEEALRRLSSRAQSRDRPDDAEPLPIRG